MRKHNVADIVADIRQARKQCGVFNLTFAPVPERHKKETEQYLAGNFALWWDSWIEPSLKEIEAKYPRKKGTATHNPDGSVRF